MSKIVLKVENISKQYRLGQLGTGTISHDLNRWWHTVRGKEDPYLKLGDTNDRSKLGGSDYVWSLRDINFEVQQGEVLGIIGKNGAGKSTLLKILSQVTTPTTGSVKARGRIAALLEVGTGFHPDLSGRENIFLNGAILGMTKHEINSKLDEIVDFSGVAKYLDTPVKRYSSGMMVRLGFAVAAHLEPEILIVDEVLAVGDAEFQKKCLGKMKEVSGQGRTVLFVSHNMEAVKNLCSQVVILDKGRTSFFGETNEIVNKYLANSTDYALSKKFKNVTNKNNGISQIEILGDNSFHNHDEIIKILIHFTNPIANCYVGVAMLNANKVKLFTTVNLIEKETDKLICEIPAGLLLKGSYSIDVATFKSNLVYEYLEDICPFQVLDFVNDYQIYGGGGVGDIKVDCKWC